MEDELKACKPLKRANLWQRWAGFLSRDQAINELLHHVDVAKHIFFSMIKYPPCTLNSSAAGKYGDDDDVPAEHWKVSLPELVTKHQRYFVTRFETEYIDFLLKHFLSIQHNVTSYYESWSIVSPDGWLKLPEFTSFESFRELYMYYYSLLNAKNFVNLQSQLVGTVGDVIQKNYGWDKFAIFIDDVCNELLKLPSVNLTPEKEAELKLAKVTAIKKLLQLLASYYHVSY